MICVNELSFLEQAKNAYEATDLMHEFAHLIGNAQLILNDRTSAHSEFYNRPIAPDFTVFDWLIAKTTDQVSKVLLLALTKKGPFVDDLIRSTGHCACHACDQSVAFGGLAGAAHFGGVAVSLVGAGPMSDNPILVQLCVEQCKEKSIPNLTEDSDLSVFERKYRPSQKHKPHGAGTTMDLDDETAQRILNIGITYRRRIYSMNEGTYYVFNSDNAGGFHGYPVDENDVPYEVRNTLP